MRSRHTMAMLKLMEIDDLIAADEADYVRIAVRIGVNAELRTALRERVLERRDCLYKDIGAVRAFEEMVRREVAAIARVE